MTRATRAEVRQINGVETGGSERQAQTPTHEGVLLQRKRRRRLDLKTLHGTMRESARVYRDLAEGRITYTDAEVRSRVLVRHKDVLSALTTQQQIDTLTQKLERLSNTRAALPHIPDLDGPGPVLEHQPAESPEMGGEQ